MSDDSTAKRSTISSSATSICLRSAWAAGPSTAGPVVRQLRQPGETRPRRVQGRRVHGEGPVDGRLGVPAQLRSPVPPQRPRPRLVRPAPGLRRAHPRRRCRHAPLPRQRAPARRRGRHQREAGSGPDHRVDRRSFRRPTCCPTSRTPSPAIPTQRWTHLRLRIYPDGGVARFRAYGEVMPDPENYVDGELVDLASVALGAAASPPRTSSSVPRTT
jgi:hypothetical protein